MVTYRIIQLCKYKDIGKHWIKDAYFCADKTDTQKGKDLALTHMVLVVRGTGSMFVPRDKN